MNPRECRTVIASLALATLTAIVVGALLAVAVATGDLKWLFPTAVWLFDSAWWIALLVTSTRGAIRRIQIEAYDRMVENMLDQLAWFRETKEQL